MPYIKQEQRDALDFAGDVPTTAGELNYVITKVCIGYMKRGHKSYQEINDILGALEGAKLEFYRRVAVPYEEGKIETNGDVY